MSQTALLPTEVEELGRIIRIPRIRIRPFPDQPRKYFDRQELQELADSVKSIGQIVPASVIELPEPDVNGCTHELVNGQRRWHALDMAGIRMMKVEVLTVKDVEEQFLISVASNFGGAGHGAMEIANAIVRFRKNGKEVEEIRKIFGKSGSWVYQHLKLVDKLHPKVQAMMSQEVPEEKRLVFSVALLVADVPTDLQEKIAETIVGENLKAVQAKDFIRRQGKKHDFSVGNHERTPRKDYEVLLNFANKLQRDLGVLTQFPKDFFEKLFEFRDAADHAQMLLLLDRGIEDLRRLKETVRRAKK